MNVCIDIDGTLTEPHYWLKRANAYFGLCVKPEDVTDYSIDRVMGLPPGSFSRFYERYGKLLHQESKIRPGVKKALRQLARENRLHYVSARAENMRDVTEEWLGRHNLPGDSLALLGSPDKVWKARQLQADVFIEDCYENALQLAEAGFSVLLIDCTYNMGALPKNTVRVRDWSEIREWIDRRRPFERSQSGLYDSPGVLRPINGEWGCPA